MTFAPHPLARGRGHARSAAATSTSSGPPPTWATACATAAFASCARNPSVTSASYASAAAVEDPAARFVARVTGTARSVGRPRDTPLARSVGQGAGATMARSFGSRPVRAPYGRPSACVTRNAPAVRSMTMRPA